MSKEIKFCFPEDSLKSALEKMTKFEIRHLPVIADEKIAGLISDRDLLRNSSLLTKSTATVKSIMSKQVVMARESTSIKNISQVMLEDRISCLPIVDEHHEMTGILTNSDLLRFILNDQGFEVFI